MAEPKLQELNAQEFQENTANSRIDRQSDAKFVIIHGVKLLGNSSVNRGRKYPFKVRNAANSLFESVPIYNGHREPGKSHPPGNRIGVVKNVQAREEGTFGDAYFKKSHHLTNSIIDDIEDDTASWGMSPDLKFKGVVRRSGNQDVHEITAVESVDVVTKPATNVGAFEEEQPKKESEMPEPFNPENLTRQQFKALESQRPEFFEELVPKTELIAAQEALEQAKTELTETKTKLDEFQVRESVAAHKANVDTLLEKAKLPDSAKTETFLTTLYALESTKEGLEQVEALIQDRVDLVKGTSSGVRSASSGDPFNHGKEKSALEGFDPKAALKDFVGA